MPQPEVEDFKGALDRARMALELLQRYRIPPTPPRFTVAYLYYAGDIDDLVRVMDRLVNHEKLNAQTADEVHEQFFGRRIEEAELREASKRIETTVSQVVEYIDSAADNAEHYGTVLAGFTDTAQQSSPELGKAMSTVLDETKQMAETNRGLEEKLQASSREIVQLREHLERLEREASMDGLTGVANRKRFDVSLRQEIATANREQSQVSLLMVDIDFFKKFNDTYGHLLGDQVLRLVARYLTDCIKGNDLAARYGGEEFAVILPRTRLDDAVHVAEQIRSHVASKKVVNRRTGEALGKITLSIGVGEYKTGETPSELIHRADEALYLAKKAGRDRVMSETQLAAAGGSARTN
ncbi:MAG TPA: GGDEF domain-containing protein [Magnetospirillaceae bacterium]|jgi:diguanylate cyclase